MADPLDAAFGNVAVAPKTAAAPTSGDPLDNAFGPGVKPPAAPPAAPTGGPDAPAAGGAAADAPFGSNTIEGRLLGVGEAGVHAVARAATGVAGAVGALVKWGMTGDIDAFSQGQAWATKTANVVPQNEVAQQFAALPGKVTEAVRQGLNTIPGYDPEKGTFSKPGKIGDIVTSPLAAASNDWGNKADAFSDGVESIDPSLKGQVKPILGAIARTAPYAPLILAGAEGPLNSMIENPTLTLRKAAGKTEAAAGSASAQKTAYDKAVTDQTTNAPAASVGAMKANPGAATLTEGVEPSRGEYGFAKIGQVGADGVSQVERGNRAAVASEIMGDNVGSVREAVLSGKEEDYRNEYMLAKAAEPTPEGEIIKNQLASEQNQLSHYAGNIVEDTDTSPTLLNDAARGGFVRAALSGGVDDDGVASGMMGAIKNAKTQAYNKVMTEGAKTAAKADNLTTLLADPVFNAELKRQGMTDLGSGTADLLKTTMQTGFKDAPPGTVAALEQLRQSNNAAWAKDGSNGWAISQMNAAIDADQTAAAAASGNQTMIAGLQNARAIHQAQQRVTGSEGIKSLIGETDANGVAIRGQTADEDVMKKLTNMSDAQHAHVLRTLQELSQGRVGGMDLGESVTPDIRQMAHQATNEMAGGLAREVQQAGGNKVGDWNANAVNKTRNALSEKIKNTLDPELQRRIRVLDEGGQIMPSIHSYEGAGLQTRRAEKLGVAATVIQHAAEAAGGVAGEVAGGPWGAAWGAIGGKKLAQGVQAFRQAGKLREAAATTQQAMRDNYAFGREVAGE